MWLRQLALSLTIALSVGCSSTNRSGDAVHATNRTIGESVDTVTETPSPRNVVVDAVTFPVRLVRGVVGALISESP